MGWFGLAVAGFFGGLLVYSGLEMDAPTILRVNQPQGAYVMGVVYFWARVLAILAVAIASVMINRRS